MGAFRSRPPITSWGMGVRGDHRRKGGRRGNAPLHSLCLLLPLYPDDQYPEASSCQPCRPACLLTPSFLTLTLVQKKKKTTKPVSSTQTGGDAHYPRFRRLIISTRHGSSYKTAAAAPDRPRPSWHPLLCPTSTQLKTGKRISFCRAS